MRLKDGLRSETMTYHLERAGVNHPPVSRVAPLADSVANGRDTVANVNKRGEAYTENLVGQRGGAPP